MGDGQPGIMPGRVGELSQAVIDALGLNLKSGRAILLGETNIRHMLGKHPAAYHRYAHPCLIFWPRRIMLA